MLYRAFGRLSPVTGSWSSCHVVATVALLTPAGAAANGPRSPLQRLHIRLTVLDSLNRSCVDHPKPNYGLRNESRRVLPHLQSPHTAQSSASNHCRLSETPGRLLRRRLLLGPVWNQNGGGSDGARPYAVRRAAGRI